MIMIRDLLKRFPAVSLERPRSPSGAEGLWTVEKPSLLRLHVQGTPEALRLLEKLPDRGLGIVGTREPQHRCEALVSRVVSELRGRDLIIVSGFARGIDTAAHKAALDHGLPTLAILGCGLEVDYPNGHAPLRRRILEAGGLVVTEFEPGAPPFAGQFHRRNRLIAGWTKATWVVQAGFRSGALNTASWAAKQGRGVYVTPAFPDDPALAGNQRLFQHLSTDVHALFDSRDLDRTWPELRSGPRADSKKRISPGATAGYARTRDARSRALASRVEMLGKAQGGASVEQLLDWGLQERGWLPMEFFDALSGALDCGWVRDLGGTLVAEPDVSPPVGTGVLPPAP